MNEPKTKPMEELQIVEDPNYIPPPEIEERIYDPYAENEDKPSPAPQKYNLNPPRKRATPMQVVLGCTLSFIVIVGGWGLLFVIAEKTGESWIAGIPLFLLAAFFCYGAQQHARSEAVKEGIRRADKDRRRRRQRRKLD